jgi:hypothetical protein
MTPKNPSSHRKPAGGHRHQRRADRTFIHPILRPRPPIAPTSTGLGARDRTPRHFSRDLSADQAIQRLPSKPSPTPPPTVGAHQIPIDPRRYRPAPRVPSLEAFGRRPAALPATSRPAGIRNPSHDQRSRWQLPISALRSGSGRPRPREHPSGGPPGLPVPQVRRQHPERRNQDCLA